MIVKSLSVSILSFAIFIFSTHAFGDDLLIKSVDTWKYLDNGSNQGTVWRNIGFSDASWATGWSQFGYGDGDEATVVSDGDGPMGAPVAITTYFRKTINIVDPTSYISLFGKMLVDDGAVVYINGTEVYRHNMPAGPIAYNTPASSSLESNFYFNLSTAPLVAGTNVIAVEIHQSSTTSSDISFYMELLGQKIVTNDEPCTATALPTVNSDCIYSYHNNNTATHTTTPGNPGCGSYSASDEDVWFRVTVPASGRLNIKTTTFWGEDYDGAMAVYRGVCGSLTLIECDDNDGFDNMPEITRTDYIPGETLFIRVWEKNGNNLPFGICAAEFNTGSSCTAGPSMADNCASANLITDISGYCANTGSFTPDLPSNIDDQYTVFCPTVQNNSWIRFIASNTVASFTIQTPTCASGQSIQIAIYEALGSCSRFIRKSECFDPYSQITSVITATDLTPGNQYYIMVDGAGGSNCDFRVSVSSGVSLSSSILYFNAKKNASNVLLTWQVTPNITVSEYRIEKLINPDDLLNEWSSVKTIPNQYNQQIFTHKDLNAFHSDHIQEILYKLIEIHSDQYESIASIQNVTNSPDEDFYIHHIDHSDNQLLINGYSQNAQSLTINILTMEGKNIYQSKHTVSKGAFACPIPLPHCSAGIYGLTIMSDKKVYSAILNLH